MKSNKLFLLFLVLLVFTIAGCGKKGGGSSAPATIVSISVTPVNASISLGTAQQFTATGNYSNNTQGNVTQPVTWNSSNTSVATIDPTSGNAVSVATGTSLITASTPSFSASTVLKVTSGGNVTGTNVMLITVNGSLCSVSYLNKPCVSVTICDATNNCNTINDILVDTMSFGLRIFKQALGSNISPTPVMQGSQLLAECVTYGDGSSEWGPIQTVGVKLASEPTVTMAIQVIDQTFATPPAATSLSSGCSDLNNAETSPANAGFNGVFGIGPLKYDCGLDCVSSSKIGQYWVCAASSTGSPCNPASVSLTNQVQNPVSLLPVDNNGVIVELPSVSPNGAPSADGSLVLGIGTQSNNMPTAVTTYPANGNGDIVTSFNGQDYTSFIDTGSNGIFFPTTLPSCTGGYSAWLCPPNLTSLIATNQGASGTPSADVSFIIGNFNTLLNSSNRVFNDVGGNEPSVFDWGLPFFLGRNIYVGFSTASSPPYWAY